MTLYKWSQTAATNANADSTCPFPEGMSPAAVNDGTRGMMAAAAKYRDDMAGAIVTGGTSTAYTVSSFQGFDTLVHLDGKEIAFTPHVTNGANGTSLNVDGLGVRPILVAPGAGLPVGVLVQGTPYIALYNNTDGAFYLKGYFGQPFSIPLGGGLDYWGPTAPNSCFAFPTGQAISRTTYAALFSLFGTTFGAGDGTTTFTLPDRRGRVSPSLDNMGGTASGRLPTFTGLGFAGGEASHVLAAGEIPSITSAGGALSVSVSAARGDVIVGTPTSSFLASGGGPVGTVGSVANATIASNGSTSAQNVTSNNTGGGAHNNIQPIIVCNYIIRIL